MADATENWSDRRLVKAAGGNWSATRSWDIINATTETECLTATIIGGSTLVPAFNEQHPDQSRLKVRSREVERPGFNMWRLTCTYEIPVDDSGFDDGDGDPLDEPVKFEWEIGNETISIDRDRDGHPLLNSAGDPFETNPQRQRLTLHLVLKRYEPFFDVQLPMAYMNTVNSESFTVPGLGIVQAGQAYRSSIEAAAPYSADFQSILVEYRFRFDPLGFQLKLIDQGYQSWWHKTPSSDDVKGRITTKDELTVSKPVLLNGAGRIIDTTLVVGDNSPTSSISSNPSLPLGMTAAAVHGASTAFTISYDIIPESNFSDLGF